MTESPQRRTLNLLGRHRKSFGFVWLIGLGVYLAAIWLLGWRNMREAFSNIDLRFIAALAVVECTALWLRVWKWRLVLGAGQQAVGLALLSKAGGNLSPARLGEFTPLLLSKHRSPRLGAWIVADRLLEIAATLGLGILGLFALSLDNRFIVVLWAIGGVLIVAAAAFCLTRQRLFVWLGRRFTLGVRWRNLMAALSRTARAMARLGPKLPVLASVTFLTKLMDIATAFLLFAAFGYSVAFTALAAGQCIHGLTSIIPFTPNATGVPYAATATFLHYAAAVPLEILAAVIPVRFAVAGVVFWSSFGFGIGSLRKELSPASSVAPSAAD